MSDAEVKFDTYTIAMNESAVSRRIAVGMYVEGDGVLSGSRVTRYTSSAPFKQTTVATTR